MIKPIFKTQKKWTGKTLFRPMQERTEEIKINRAQRKATGRTWIMDIVIKFLKSALRKAIFGTGTVLLAKLVNMGLITEDMVGTILEHAFQFASGALLILVPMLWTFIKDIIVNKFFKK